MKQNTRIEISPKTIVFTVGFLISLYIVYLIKDVLFGIFVSILLMTALNPLVNRLQRRGLPRSLSISLVFLTFLSVVITFLAIVIPAIADQTQSLLQLLRKPEVQSFINRYLPDFLSLQSLNLQIGSIPKLFSVVSSTFSIFVTVITVMVITFYLLLERSVLHKHLAWFFGNKDAEVRAAEYLNRVETEIGKWVRGQLFLMIVIGVMTFVGLSLLGVPYALPLAVFAGFLELVPNIGPTIAAVPAILVGFASGNAYMGTFVLVLYVLIQQLENNFIVPKVMQSTVGLNPLATIVLFLVAYRLGGVGGAVLAIPVFLVIKVSVREYYQLKTRLAEKLT
jgi:predicted PurR-regulated permease PerM